MVGRLKNADDAQVDPARARESMDPKSLVTGANGYTGSNLCSFLARRGVPTRGMYWEPDGTPDFSHENLELVPGELRDRASLDKALEGIETVYHVAALYRATNVPNQVFWDVNVEGVRNMIELSARHRVRRFVHCSTIGVHGHVENPPANEASPIKPDDYYQYTKLEGEEVARELGGKLGLEVSIVRPAAIYGSRERRFLKIPKGIQDRTWIRFGSGEVLYHFVHIDDLCEAFVACAERPEAVGETFIIADDHALTLNEIVSIMADELGVSPPPWKLPLFVLTAASVAVELACKPFGIDPPLHRRRASWFTATRSFDITKARRLLAYAPRVRPEEGLRDMVRSYREAGWLR